MVSQKVFDTVILGAGWSGAVAARDLTAKGYSVLILEGRDRVGGRAQTWRDKGKGDVKIDVGCSWIHGYTEGNPTREIAKGLGVNSHLPKPAESVIYGPDGPLSSSAAAALRASLSAAQSSFKTPHPPPAPSASLASALFSSSSPLFSPEAEPNQSSDVTNTSPADPTVAAEAAKSSPSDNKELAAAFARTLEVPLGLKLEKASLRWSGWESTTSFAGSDAAPDGGYEALVGKVISQAKSQGAEVQLNSVIKNVLLDQDRVVMSIPDGSLYSAKTAICTLPLGVLKTLPETAFHPPLPPSMQESIKATQVGVLEKLILHYPSAWWPDADKIGSYTFLPTASTPTESSTLEQIFAGSTLVCSNAACPTLPSPSPTLLTYLSETPATLLLRHPSDAVANAYHQYLISRFKPSTPPPDPIESNLTTWLTDPFSFGATTTPSIISENGERSPMDFKELSRPVWGGRLGFAGEHTEMEHRGSVAGAVVSGTREAERVGRLLAKLAEQGS